MRSGRANKFLDRSHGTLSVDRQCASEQKFGVQAAKYDIGISDSRLRAAAVITGGPRIGADAFRADVEEATLVYARDAAAASADRVHRD